MCLSLVRHMSHLFKFLTQTLTLHSRQAEHSSLCILHVYPRVSVCFALTLTTFKRSSGTSGKSVVGGSSQPHVLAPSQFCLGPICLTSPSTFLNWEIHICTVILLSDGDLQWYIRGYFSHIFSETPITILRQNDILTSYYVV